jgi:dTDP-4-dehydrorhamnose reductase
MRILVTGAGGSLGAYVVEALTEGGAELIAWGREPGEVRSGGAIQAVDLEAAGLDIRLDEAMPDVVLHLAAVSSAEAARLDPGRAGRVNVEATARIAGWCERRGRRLVFTSTDLVFDGSKAWNREDDPAAPVLAYGRTKREAESLVAMTSRGLVARVSLLYGFRRNGRDAYFDRTVAALRRGEPQRLFEDEFRTPLDLATAARLLIALARTEATGVVHVAGRERMSRFDLIRRAAVALGLDPSLVRANHRADVALPEPRPADVSLDTSRLAMFLPGIERPTVEDVLRSSGIGDDTGGRRPV